MYLGEEVNGGPPPQKSGIKIIFFLVFIRNKIVSCGGKRGGQLVGDMFLGDFYGILLV